MHHGLMRGLGLARLVAGLCVVFWGYLFFGLIDLAVVLDRTPGFYDSYLLETGWGHAATAGGGRSSLCRRAGNCCSIRSAAVSSSWLAA
jgi:hypothetical protein